MKVKRRKGLTGTLEQALLVAVTIALFITLVVGPMASTVDNITSLPTNAWKSWNDFVNWVYDSLDKVFSGQSSSGGT